MRLTSWEEQRLLLFSAAELARRRRDRGLRLNAPEAIAIICDAMLEAARDGGTLADVEAAGRAAVRSTEVLEGVRELVDEVRLEVLLDDGTRLVVLTDPISADRSRVTDGPGAVIAGGAGGEARTNPAGERRALVVRNTSRRVVRVSSHIAFDRVNPRLAFDRAAARGLRLDLPAGASERWTPGEEKSVDLVPLRGEARA